MVSLSGSFDEAEDGPTLSDALQHIDENHKDCEFPLDVCMFKCHQSHDEALAVKVQADSKRNINDRVHTLKEVEDLVSVHENNKLVVPLPLRQREMNWCHCALVHPGRQIGTMHQNNVCLERSQGRRKQALQRAQQAPMMQTLKQSQTWTVTRKKVKSPSGVESMWT